MQFEKIYLLGKGRVAAGCRKIAGEFWGREIEDLSSLSDNELDQRLNSISGALIISANNFHIIKDQCLANNTVINYHNALLPQHKGVHAHVWAIYEGDRKSGITWHKVVKDIDAGDIIVQREIELDDQITGIKLLQLQQNLALSSFRDCLEVLAEDKPLVPQQKTGKTHLRREIPENGKIDPEMSFDKLSRLLRATDCGIPEMKPYLNIDDKKYTVERYAIAEDHIDLFMGRLKLTVNR